MHGIKKEYNMLLAYRCHNIVIDITTLSSISRVIKVGGVGVGGGGLELGLEPCIFY